MPANKLNRRNRELFRSRCSSVVEVDTTTNSVTVTWPDVRTLQHVMFCSRGKAGNEFEFLKSLEASQQTNSMTENGSGTHRERVRPSDLAVLFPTSGSTGQSKLTAFTQASVLDVADNWQCLFRLQDDDILFQVEFASSASEVGLHKAM